MANFAYTVRDASGSIHKGNAEADTADVLKTRLTEQGFEVQDVTPVKGKQSSGGVGGVKLNELALFCRQFSTMVDAGVSLVRCLDVLSRQTESPKLRRILVDVGQRVEGGESLSKAMARHPKAFNSLFIGLIRAGEVGGVLEETLQRLAHFLEKDVELRRKVKAALTYPVIVVFVAGGVIAVLVFYVVPQFIQLFRDLGMKDDDMPATTRFLIDLSNFCLQKWWLLAIIIGAFVFGNRLFSSSKFGRRTLDRIKLKVPVFGPLHHKICLDRFSRTFGTLLGSGVPILQAMETVAGMVGNNVLADAILEARARIREGDRIGDPLEKSGHFPPMVVHMIGIGEESGSLDYMLSKIADFYEQEVDALLQSLTAALEPVIIVFLGVVVLFIIISMFAPILSVITNLSQ